MTFVLCVHNLFSFLNEPYGKQEVMVMLYFEIPMREVSQKMPVFPSSAVHDGLWKLFLFGPHKVMIIG